MQVGTSRGGACVRAPRSTCGGGILMVGAAAAAGVFASSSCPHLPRSLLQTGDSLSRTRRRWHLWEGEAAARSQSCGRFQNRGSTVETSWLMHPECAVVWGVCVDWILSSLMVPYYPSSPLIRVAKHFEHKDNYY